MLMNICIIILRSHWFINNSLDIIYNILLLCGGDPEKTKKMLYQIHPNFRTVMAPLQPAANMVCINSGRRSDR
jgi:hypothetical protein